MSKEQRDWARQHPWFYCSDSRAIWVKDEAANVIRFTSMRALKLWAGETK